MAESNLTPERVRELLDYDRDSGLFVWKAPNSNRTSAGNVAGTIRHGYVLIGVDGRQRLAHRLAWLLVTGEWPTADIDHINGNRSDNRIANLRQVTRSVNMENQRRPRGNNSSGFLGVGWDKEKRRWRAQIKVNGVNLILGRFRTPEEAHGAYIAAKRKLHEGCTI